MAFKIKDGVSVGLVDVFNNNGELLVNAPTASKWLTARTLTLTGDVTGTVNSVDGSGDISITTAISANSVTLGTDTTGNYVATITGSDGVDVSGSGSESAAITINHSDTSTLSGQYGGSGIASVTVDGKGHVTAIETANFLTSFTEADTLQTVTNRGATTNVAVVSITSNTASTTNNTGALVVTGGVGIGGAVNIAGNTTIAGDLTVSGTTTTVNSVTTTLTDPILTLGGTTAPTTDDNKDRGVEFRYHNGTTAKLGFFGFDDSTGKFTFIPDATNSSEVFTGTKGTLDANIEYEDILNKPTIGSGTLDLSIGAAGGTNTSVTIGTGTGFNANSTTNYTYSVRVGPALGNLVALMTGAGTGLIEKTGQDTFALDTTNYLTQAVTTFSTGVTGLTATGTEHPTTPVANTPLTGNVVLSGVLDLDNGGTGANTAGGARTNLGASVLGSNLFTVTDPSAVRYIRVNANNTVSLLTDLEFRQAIGADFQLTINTIGGITGGPVTNSGTYTFELDGTTRSIHNLTTNGILVKTGTTSVATRKLVAGTGITLINDDGVSGDITINATAATETDTLDSVTDRDAVTPNSIRIGGVGYDVSGTNVAEVKAITLIVESASATPIDSWSTTTYRSAKYFVQIKQGDNYETGELIVTHNGTQAKLTHYGVLETNTALTAATGFTGAIVGTTLTLNVVMASATTAQLKIVRTIVRV